MREYRFILLLFVLALVGGLLVAAFSLIPRAATPAAVIRYSPYVYSFNVDGILNEAGAIEMSTSPYWWVNSGGELLITDGIGATMQGEAPEDNPWRMRYAKNNPVDTDEGLHPQNIFRLVTRSMWNDASEQARFYIVRDNFSSSPNRNESNGLLLFSRYELGGQTLYYAGIRVDGTAVIKKKYHGIYYTMEQKQIFPGTYRAPQSEKNLIPHQEWIALRADTITAEDGTVRISLSMQREDEADWATLLTAQDKGQYGDTPPITGSAYMGIRTDFMDVKFQSFKLTSLHT